MNKRCRFQSELHNVSAPLPKYVKPHVPRPPRPSIPPVQRPASPVPEQQLQENGLYRFYHPLRAGEPLPDGPVAPAASEPDSEFSCKWMLEEVFQRIRKRSGLCEAQADLMVLWNSFVEERRPISSDRKLPQLCRRFALEHATSLTSTLREAFVEHLVILWEFNLIHTDDIDDCIILIDGDYKQLCKTCFSPMPGCLHGAALWPVGVGNITAADILTRPAE